MNDKMYFTLSSADVAVRLRLILKVHGLKQVESYFNNVSKQLRDPEVYISLMNCYATERSVEKAEVLMQKMRDMGFAKTTQCYNALMNVYYRTENYEKLHALFCEMEEKGITGNQFTFGICLSAYAAVSNVEEMDKIMKRMEDDPQLRLDWNMYSVAAHGYLKLGMVDKATTVLKKYEGVMTGKRTAAFNLLLKLYAKTGKKDELHRIWNLYNGKEKIYNKAYMSMISSLLNLDDLEGAEKVFREWESHKSSYDIRVPKLLIDEYCKRGLLEKAESVMNDAETKGAERLVDAWCSLAFAYLESTRIPKAMDAMKKAIIVCKSGPTKEILVTCLADLESGNTERATELINSLKL